VKIAQKGEKTGKGKGKRKDPLKKMQRLHFKTRELKEKERDREEKKLWKVHEGKEVWRERNARRTPTFLVGVGDKKISLLEKARVCADLEKKMIQRETRQDIDEIVSQVLEGEKRGTGRKKFGGDPKRGGNCVFQN